jgi:hypothetical protein
VTIWAGATPPNSQGIIITQNREFRLKTVGVVEFAVIKRKRKAIEFDRF